MPETAAAGGLARDRHLSCPKIDNGQPGRFLPGTGWPPARFLSRIGSVDCRSRPRLIAIHSLYLTVTHDCHSHFIAGDHRLMRYPFIGSFGIEGAQTAAIRKNGPCTLR